jgi:hypothetical protein
MVYFWITCVKQLVYCGLNPVLNWVRSGKKRPFKPLIDANQRELTTDEIDHGFHRADEQHDPVES